VGLKGHFREVVLVDSEFRSTGNGLYLVRCVCAKQLVSGKETRLWISDEQRARCPYPVSPDTLFVAHYASAELITHMSLGWKLPSRILDTCVVFGAATAGLRRGAKSGEGRGMVDALRWYNEDTLSQTEKTEMRDLCLRPLRNSEFTTAERKALIDYCWSDVAGLEKLLPHLEEWLWS
jgi:hypothetical protein